MLNGGDFDPGQNLAAFSCPIDNNIDLSTPEKINNFFVPKNRRISSSSTTTRFNDEKIQLSFYLASVLKSSMTKLLDDQENIDLILKTEDGSKIGVHSCILKTRCPSFFDRYVKNQIQENDQDLSKNPIILISDVNFDSLKFYLKCIYAEDRIPSLVGGSLGENSEEKMQNSNLETENVEISLKNDEIEQNSSKNEENSTKMEENLPKMEENLPKIGENLPKSEENSTVQEKSMDSSTKTFTMMQNSGEKIVEGTENLGDNVETSAAATNCMTSFLDLAASSSQNIHPIDSSAEHPSSEPLPANLSIANSWDGFTTCRMIDQQQNQQMSISATSVVEKSPKKIFDMYIDLEKSKISDSSSIFEDEMTPKTVRKNSNHRKRWSITSLKSVDDSTTTSNLELSSPVSSIQIVQCFTTKNASEKSTIFRDKNVDGGGACCSKLAKDLLEMFLQETSSDAIILVENDKIIKAHKCILLAACPAFRSLLSHENSVDLKEFRECDVKFLMKFLYGGLVDVPDDVDVWRLYFLSDFLQLETLKKVLHLHIKAKFCHYFHKPCPSCSTNILEFCLPNLRRFPFFNDLYAKCLRWQAKYFLRIWKMKSFAALDAENLAICQKSLHQMINAENVIDILMGCEKLRQFFTTTTTTNNRPSEKCSSLASKLPLPPTPNFYDNLCTNLYNASFDVLAKNLPTVLDSSSFLELGKGYALNMPLVEDVLPKVIHLLSPEMGCHTLMKLYEILHNLASDNSPSSNEDEYNEKFVSFLKRLYEICDTHLIHKASEVVECKTWPLLNEQMRERIKEIGIFVDMKKPSAPPPKLSSLNRSYKRSSSSATTTLFSSSSSKNLNSATSRDRSLSQRKFKRKEEKEKQQQNVSEKTSVTTMPDGKNTTENVVPEIMTSASVASTPKNEECFEEKCPIPVYENTSPKMQPKTAKNSQKAANNHHHHFPAPGSTVQKSSTTKKTSSSSALPTTTAKNVAITKPLPKKK